MILDVVDAVNDILVPRNVGEEADEAEQEADTQGWDGDEQTDKDAGGDGQGGLLVVLAGEEGGILQGAVGTDEGELGPSKDRIRLEGSALEKAAGVEAAHGEGERWRMGDGCWLSSQ